MEQQLQHMQQQTQALVTELRRLSAEHVALMQQATSAAASSAADANRHADAAGDRQGDGRDGREDRRHEQVVRNVGGRARIRKTIANSLVPCLSSAHPLFRPPRACFGLDSVFVRLFEKVFEHIDLDCTQGLRRRVGVGTCLCL
jgi:hypothetical protein